MFKPALTYPVAVASSTDGTESIDATSKSLCSGTTGIANPEVIPLKRATGILTVGGSPIPTNTNSTNAPGIGTNVFVGGTAGLLVYNCTVIVTEVAPITASAARLL